MKKVWEKIWQFYDFLNAKADLIFRVILLVVLVIIAILSWKFRYPIADFILSEKVSFIQLATGIGGVLTIIGLFWRAKISDETVKNQTHQLKNEETTQKNQQFLDAVRLFDDAKSQEAKIGAIYYMESLAISSPAHRQRCIDFLCGLNEWMREYIEKYENDPKSIAKALEDVKPIISNLGEIVTEVVVNIVRHHCKNLPNEEAYRGLNLNKKIFVKANFSYIVFPKNFSYFVSTIFLDFVHFRENHFCGQANFIDTKFYGNAFFSEVEFYDLANFAFAKFLDTAGFNSRFSGVALFASAEFSGATNFNNAKFQNDVFFNKTDFKKAIIYEGVKPLMPLNIYKKANLGGALFTKEQDKFYEDLEKEIERQQAIFNKAQEEMEKKKISKEPPPIPSK